MSSAVKQHLLAFKESTWDLEVDLGGHSKGDGLGTNQWVLRKEASCETCCLEGLNLILKRRKNTRN